MPLIATYDSSDAYLTQEEYNNLQNDEKEFREPETYDDFIDQNNWEDFEYKVENAFKNRKFPLVLVARKSNWRGQDGFARCNTTDEVISKVASFDGSYIELYRGRGNSLWFKTASHDVPTGILIEVKPFNQAYWEK